MKKLKELYEKYLKKEEKVEDPEKKKKKMILFFGFYFIFFIILLLYLNSLKKDLKVVDEEEVRYKTTLIENGTYSYQYNVTANDEVYTFSGSIKDENYELSEYKYKDLLDIYNIKIMLKKAKYLYKTETGSGLVKYEYEITNTNLAKILNDNENIEDNTNSIVIYVDKDHNLYQVDMDLSNYMKTINEYEIYKLTIKYGVFGNEESSTN